jgi:hypothetical protein
VSAIEQWAAVMLNGRNAPRVGWGPISDRRQADDFAKFITDEMDPARVIPLRSPASELLAWRGTVIRDIKRETLRPASDAPPMLGDQMGAYGMGAPQPLRPGDAVRMTAAMPVPGHVSVISVTPPDGIGTERARGLRDLADTWDKQASEIVNDGPRGIEPGTLAAMLLRQAARQLRERLGDGG